MLEKLLGVRSFSGFINHLTCCQTTFLTFSNKLSFPSIIWIATLIFLRCALIAPKLVTHFKQNDHPILLDAITHVEINISPFYVAL